MRCATRMFLLVSISILAITTAFAANEQRQSSPSSKDFSDLRKIEKALSMEGQQGPIPDRNRAAIRKAFASVSAELGRAPSAEKPLVLANWAKLTKWGSPERYAAYYVCAWYGVDYKKCIGYLTNVAGWWERGFEKAYKAKLRTERLDSNTGTLFPFSYQEEDFSLLYALYERNHDFRLLHDIVTTQSDGAGAEAITSVIADAAKKHPRGLLHVAALSNKGWVLVSNLLRSPEDPRNPGYIMADRSSLQVLRSYTKRVAADGKDPLRGKATRLLRR